MLSTSFTYLFLAFRKLKPTDDQSGSFWFFFFLWPNWYFPSTDTRLELCGWSRSSGTRACKCPLHSITSKLIWCSYWLESVCFMSWACERVTSSAEICCFWAFCKVLKLCGKLLSVFCKIMEREYFLPASCSNFPIIKLKMQVLFPFNFENHLEVFWFLTITPYLLSLWFIVSLSSNFFLTVLHKKHLHIFPSHFLFSF